MAKKREKKKRKKNLQLLWLHYGRKWANMRRDVTHPLTEAFIVNPFHATVMKERFTTVDLFAVLHDLRSRQVQDFHFHASSVRISRCHRLVGMRAANVYDVDQKTYLIKFARYVWALERVFSLFSFPWGAWCVQLQTRRESRFALRVWVSHAHHRVRLAQEYATFWFRDEGRGDLQSCTLTEKFMQSE